jgi:putative membrane protein
MVAASAARQGQDSHSDANRHGNAGSQAGGSMMLSSTDRKFAMAAASGGMAEVEMARVALQRASSDEVKQYAQKMIEDHTRANEELMQLAASKGLTLPTGPDAKQQAMMRKMMGLSGAAFDREYVKTSGVKAHEQMAKLFMNEQSKGRDADLKAFAASKLPAVQMHLSMARDLWSKMNGAARSGDMSGMKM